MCQKIVECVSTSSHKMFVSGVSKEFCELFLCDSIQLAAIDDSAISKARILFIERPMLLNEMPILAAISFRCHILCVAVMLLFII